MKDINSSIFSFMMESNKISLLKEDEFDDMKTDPTEEDPSENNNTDDTSDNDTSAATQDNMDDNQSDDESTDDSVGEDDTSNIDDAIEDVDNENYKKLKLLKSYKEFYNVAKGFLLLLDDVDSIVLSDSEYEVVSTLKDSIEKVVEDIEFIINNTFENEKYSKLLLLFTNFRTTLDVSSGIIQKIKGIAKDKNQPKKDNKKLNPKETDLDDSE